MLSSTITNASIATFQRRVVETIVAAGASAHQQQPSRTLISTLLCVFVGMFLVTIPTLLKAATQRSRSWLFGDTALNTHTPAHVSADVRSPVKLRQRKV